MSSRRKAWRASARFVSPSKSRYYATFARRVACALPSGRGAAIDAFRADLEARAPLRLPGLRPPPAARRRTISAASSRTSRAPASATRWRGPLAVPPARRRRRGRGGRRLCRGAVPSRRPKRRGATPAEKPQHPGGLLAPGPPARPAERQQTARGAAACSSVWSSHFFATAAWPSCARRAPGTYLPMEEARGKMLLQCPPLKSVASRAGISLS